MLETEVNELRNGCAAAIPSQYRSEEVLEESAPLPQSPVEEEATKEDPIAPESKELDSLDMEIANDLSELGFFYAGENPVTEKKTQAPPETQPEDNIFGDFARLFPF